MQRLTTVVLSTMLLVVMGACVYSVEEPNHAERLGLNWSEDDRWRVRTTAWPERLESPARRGDTTLVRNWLYHVVDTPSDNDRRGEVVVSSPERDYSLEYDSRYHVTAVRELIGERKGTTVTRPIGYQGGWSGPSPFFPTAGEPNTGEELQVLDAFWFYPAFGQTALDRWQRFTVLSSQRSTGNWVEQKVVPLDDGVRIRLRNRDKSQTVTITWYDNEPWWSRAEWYVRDRLIMVGERITSPSRPTIRRND